MPFTFSHPAIVLPFNFLNKRRLSLTALIIGSMVPDFEYFIRMKVVSRYSHTWFGLFWFDLPLGLLLLILYNRLVKNKLIDHLPRYLNTRFSRFKNPVNQVTKPGIMVILVSLIIGTLTHILWDSFTHPTGYFVKHIHILKYPILISHSKDLQLYNIIQHLSTLIGASVIFYVIAKLPTGAFTVCKTIIYYWVKVASVVIIVLVLRILSSLGLQQYGDIIVTGISGVFIGLIFSSITTSPQRIAL